MPRFIAVHTLPWTEKDVKEMLGKQMPAMPPGVAWKFTYCGFNDHKFFCEWEAPDKSTLDKIFKVGSSCLMTLFTR